MKHTTHFTHYVTNYFEIIQDSTFFDEKWSLFWSKIHETWDICHEISHFWDDEVYEMYLKNYDEVYEMYLKNYDEVYEMYLKNYAGFPKRAQKA